ncbi:DUF1345 domain-containing protein [Subtercola sp. YIM 133946]|uniref:DUF1345 domain-containing protein n=1 Tax=Subtercola sp. YIM 133946 TaxID=3118909 RepID=UPI002F943417
MSTTTPSLPLMRRSATRAAIMLVVGVVAGLIAGITTQWTDAAVVGWICAALVYNIWTWARTHKKDAADTEKHATREDPSRATAELLLLLASLGSIAAVVVVILGSSDDHGIDKFGAGALGVLSLTLSWVLVHNLFTLRYASIYYRGTPGGVDFNQKENPRYSDFYYLAFTIGMTYQVSDTTFQTSEFRAQALRHALLSYLFGAVILASAINLVAGLAS